MKKRYLRWEQMDKSQITLDKLLGMYDIYNRSEGKTPKTLRFYNQNIQRESRNERFIEKERNH